MEYDFHTWQNVISTFRKYALGGISIAIPPCCGLRIFSSRRVCWWGNLSQRAQAYRRLQFEQQEEIAEQLQFLHGILP
jgi:hypothetical protein